MASLKFETRAKTTLSEPLCLFLRFIYNNSPLYKSNISTLLPFLVQKIFLAQNLVQQTSLILNRTWFSKSLGTEYLVVLTAYKI